MCVCNELYSDTVSLIMVKAKIQKFLDDIRVKNVEVMVQNALKC